ncbi:MAG: glycosyltransferase family 87 protein [Candidatus Promineifilaceae bacterium]
MGDGMSIEAALPLGGPARKGLRLAAAGLLLAAMAVAMTLVNYRYALQNPGGNDFLPRWLGTRLLLTEGLSPYSAEATQRTQFFYLGRPALPHEDQALFVYPIHVGLVVAPFALVRNFALARALWMTASQAALIALTLIGLRFGRWRPAPLLLAALFLFFLIWYHSARPIINGNPAVISALFIAGSMLAVSQRRDLEGGFLAIMAALKPQMVVLYLPWLALWAIYQRRGRLLAALAASAAGVIGLGWLFVPNWPAAFLAQVRAYPSYTLAGTPRDMFAAALGRPGVLLGWLLTAALGLILILAWRKSLRGGADGFVWGSFMTLALTQLIGVPTTTENFPALIPGLVYILAHWQRRWAKLKGAKVLAFLLFWFVGLWALFLTTRTGNEQHHLLFFPLPAFEILALALLAPRPAVVDRPEFRATDA